MTIINRALLKAYEHRGGTVATTQLEQHASAVVRGWAKKLRVPINPVQSASGREDVLPEAGALREAAVEKIHAEQPVVAKPASVVRKVEIDDTEFRAINWHKLDATMLRFDAAHPHEVVPPDRPEAAGSSAAARVSAPAAASEAAPVAPVAVSAQPKWSWPTIVERLLASTAANELRKLADYLLDLAADCDMCCTAFSGPGHRAGRTSLVVALAWALAEEKSARVAIVDAHFDNPGLSQALSWQPGAGLGASLCDSRRDPVEAITSLSEKLFAVPLVERVPAEAIDRDGISQLQSLLRTLRRDCDLVLVDGGPWEQASHPRVLECRAVDAFVSVARTHNSASARAGEQDLAKLGIQWLGQIETFVPPQNNIALH
jgi:hypothetical protein